MTCKAQAQVLDQKLSALFLLPLSSSLGPSHLERVSAFMAKHPPAGVIFMQGTLPLQAQAIERLEELSKGLPSAPLLYCQDAEFGLGMRLKDVPPLPKAPLLGKLSDEELLLAGLELGRECRLGGIHLNFAPVVDIYNNSANLLMQNRCYGSDPEAVARAGVLMVRGMQQAGVMACAKHFPGHGDTAVDSHHDLPLLDHSLERLKTVEWVPFRALIAAGVEAVMVGHLACLAIDPSGRPSSLSKPVIDLLREELGFAGLVVTDALNMGALENHFTPEEIAVQAFEAGADLLLYTTFSDEDQMRRLYEETIPRALEGLKQALLSGRIQETALDEKLVRIAAIKTKI